MLILPVWIIVHLCVFCSWSSSMRVYPSITGQRKRIRPDLRFRNRIQIYSELNAFTLQFNTASLLWEIHFDLITHTLHSLWIRIRPTQCEQKWSHTRSDSLLITRRRCTWSDGNAVLSVWVISHPKITSEERLVCLVRGSPVMSAVSSVQSSSVPHACKTRNTPSDSNRTRRDAPAPPRYSWSIYHDTSHLKHTQIQQLQRRISPKHVTKLIRQRVRNYTWHKENKACFCILALYSK